MRQSILRLILIYFSTMIRNCLHEVKSKMSPQVCAKFGGMVMQRGMRKVQIVKMHLIYCNVGFQIDRTL